MTGRRVEVQYYIDNTGVQVADVVVGFVYLQKMDLGDIVRLDAKLLAEGCGDREAAPDLLAADALVTYAFEATAEDATLSAKAIDARAASAMRRVATLGDAL